MHFCYIFRTIIFLSAVVSALIDYSDFTEPYDDSGSLLIDPTAPFDLNTPLFDEEFSSSLDSLAFLDQSTDPENTSSDILWGDSFKLASCSTLSRVRRADDSYCRDVTPDDNKKITESLIQGRYAISCTLLTRGVLPFALIPSGLPQDVVTNTNVLNPLATIGLGPRLYYPSTLYRATLGTKISIPMLCNSFNADFDISVLGAAALAPPFPEVWCCQNYEQTTLLFVTGFNCVELGEILSPPGT